MILPQHPHLEVAHYLREGHELHIQKMMSFAHRYGMCPVNIVKLAVEEERKLRKRKLLLLLK